MAKSEIEKNIESLKDIYGGSVNELAKKNDEIAKAEASIKAAEEKYNKAMSEFSAAAEENDIITYKETREKVTDAQAVLEYERKKLERIQAKPVITPEVCAVRVSEVETLVHDTVRHTVAAIIERMESDRRTLESITGLYKEAVNLVVLYKRDMAGIIPKRPKDWKERQAYDIIERSIINQEARDLQGYLGQACNNWFFDQYGK